MTLTHDKLQTLFSLAELPVVVTGGANGIGAGIAEVLAVAGATVVIADCDEDGAQRHSAALRENGWQAAAIQLDLADEESITCACAEIVARYGTPWGLINNAGLQDRQLLLEGTAEEWDRTNNVNARGAFLMSREIARAMVTAGNGGRIINISSAAVIGSLTTGHAAYASSKSALIGLTRACALELSEHAITVNAILPGGVITPGAINSQGPQPQGPALRSPPLGMCDPQDIGAAVLFLASLAAGAITNQALAVDGGWSVT